QQWVVTIPSTNAPINKDLDDVQKLNLTINEDNTDSINSAGKLSSPNKSDVEQSEVLSSNFSEITTTKSIQVTIPNAQILEDQKKTSSLESMVDVATKLTLTEYDSSTRTHTSSATSSEAGRSTPQSPILFDPKVQFTKPPQFESNIPTFPQSDTLPPN